MSLTVATIQIILSRRLAGWLTAAGLDPSDSANDDLLDPIATAIRQAGGSVTDAAEPSDDDAATVSDDDKLLDLAELRGLETIYTNYSKVDVNSPFGGAKLDQLRAGILRAIQAKRDVIASLYGIGGGISAVPATYGADDTSDEYSRPIWTYSP